MNEIASKILSVILSAVASGAISGVAVWLRMRKKKDNAVADGVQCLLREKIIEKHAKYVEEKHYCPIYAKESIRKAYAAYHALGGNKRNQAEHRFAKQNHGIREIKLYACRYEGIV